MLDNDFIARSINVKTSTLRWTRPKSRPETVENAGLDSRDDKLLRVWRHQRIDDPFKVSRVRNI